MHSVRGVMLLAAGCFALYAGWQIHIGERAFFAYGLGLLSIAIGIWRLTHGPAPPRL